MVENKPVTRTKAQIAAGYDRLAGIYDLLTGTHEESLFTSAIDQLAPKEGESVLEIGFGTGKAAVKLAKAVGESGRTEGIDISEGMLRVAERRIEREGLSGRIRLTQGDASRLPYDDSSFDIVFISFTLELFDTPEIPIVLAECLRVLKGGGRLCVVSLACSDRPKTAERLYEWAHVHFEGLFDCRPIAVDKNVREAGFPDLNVIEKDLWGLPVKIVIANKASV